MTRRDTDIVGESVTECQERVNAESLARPGNEDVLAVFELIEDGQFQLHGSSPAHSVAQVDNQGNVAICAHSSAPVSQYGYTATPFIMSGTPLSASPTRKP